MKRVFKLIILSFAVLMSLLVISCGGGTEEPEAKKTYKVMISYTEGATVFGTNPLTVEEGCDAVFDIEIADGYVYVSSEGAVYNYEDGTLTVKDVSKNVNIDLITEKVDYDTSATFVYVFRPDCTLDVSSTPPGMGIPAGTRIKLTAGDPTRVFLGWSLNYSIESGGNMLSREREYELTLTPDLTVGGVFTVYANYLQSNTLSYNANGGVINKNTPNMTARGYYSVSTGGAALNVEYFENYLNYFECGSSFYDDGTFTRDGYILKEYNTRPDGTGTSYSLGSKVPLTEDGYPTTLFCIWSPDTAHGDFEYKSIKLLRPVGEEYAPHWVENGIIITKYLGDDECVTIPETIDGMTVTAIDSGAFINKNMRELVMGRRIIEVRDGAFVGCDELETVYYPDGIYRISDEAFDEATYTNFKNFFVNATLAPRFVSADVGALSVKLSRLLASEDKNRIIFIGGSSLLQGLGTEYLEALLDGKYRVINYGTTRTTHGAMYLEAMHALAHEGDIVVYSPENSAYMYGERELYYKTFRDLEGMVNIYRYVDFRSYHGMFSSMSDLNRNYRYSRSPESYEAVCAHGELLLDRPTYRAATTNKYGDFLKYERKELSSSYHDTYFITMNNRVKSRFEGGIYDDSQIENKDYTDPNNVTWASIDDEYYTEIMNYAIARAKESGAAVYFGFCPVDEHALVSGADSLARLNAYNKLIDTIYDFDARLGSSVSYIFDHSYFYDCAFHTNDYGRVHRTYQVYLDLATILGIDDIKDMRDEGESFEGCLFEDGDKNYPEVIWSPKN